MPTIVPAPETSTRPARARFALGQGVRHLTGELSGIVVDADPQFPGDPEATGPVSPHQTFYMVLIQQAEGSAIACVAEAWLETDPTVETMDAEDAARWFTRDAKGHHAPRSQSLH